ncbi:MAG: hypothetical protein HC849_18990 [Oscillatoriales cyanobacterium RU_3_3]|nr:hypothetical protein [Oscillatoriales cyanobacterium RU_3_3]NJR22941.1 hypothetical protein [Richelia sp. CSU_2_1]
MTVTTENSIKALLSSSEEIMWDELSLIRYTLERQFESDEIHIYQEELFNVRKLSQCLERIGEAKTLIQKFDIFYDEVYKPYVSEILTAKYRDFSIEIDDLRQKIERQEQYMEGVRKVSRVIGTMSIAIENKDKERQYESLYTDLVELSETLEKYIIYFPQNLIDNFKNLALAFLSDSKLKPDRANQNESVFSSLVRLKNTARAVLWQIEEHRSNEKSRLTESPSDTIFAREMQIQKNQAAMNWAKSRLEKIEGIAKEKGWILE